jgi:hypothetical protein
MSFLALIGLILGFHVYFNLAILIPGVHTPLTIKPSVSISDNQWLLDLYRTVLGRTADGNGYRTNYQALQGGMSQAQLYNNFISSAEFRQNPSLASRTGFVIRVYQVLNVQSFLPQKAM